MLRVVVTGARGFLGSQIAGALSRRADIELVRFVRPDARARNGDSHDVVVDLTDESDAETAFRAVKPNAVIHAAGLVHGTPLQLFRANTVTAVVTTNAILKACPTTIVTALGSAAEYGRPVDGEPLSEHDPCRPVTPYGHAKLAASKYLMAAAERGLLCNVIRVFNPVGEVNSPQQVIGAFIAKAAALIDAPSRMIRLDRLDAVRDFVAIDDVLTLIVRLIEHRVSGELVNACSGEGQRVRDLIQFLVATSKLNYVVEEQGHPPAPGQTDIVVGDPTRFLALAGIAAPSSVRETLTRAWLRATRAHVTGQPNPADDGDDRAAAD
jgi:GDP-4-dehydro-6-deoxy-D-mannose reductase